MRHRWMWSMNARFQKINGAIELTKIVTFGACCHLGLTFLRQRGKFGKKAMLADAPIPAATAFA